MAFFKTAKRKRADPACEDRSAIAVDLLCGLVGYWEGVGREWDPDLGCLRRTNKAVSALYEMNLDGTHLIAHMDMADEEITLRNFDVWGRDEVSAELVRTVFTDGLRQSNAFAVSSVETGDDPGVWQLGLETISWDEGRPCEVRYKISRANRDLDIKAARRLISSGMKYQKVSHIQLTRKR